MGYGGKERESELENNACLVALFAQFFLPFSNSICSMAAANLQEIDSSEAIIEIYLRSHDRKNHYFPRYNVGLPLKFS